MSRAWDDHNHVFVEPKSRAATRRIPIAAHLRDLLIEQRQITRRGTGLIVGATPDRPFTASAVRRRALTDWRTAGLKPIALHECRHTFASLMIATGVNAKALTTFLGHASIETTFDLSGELMPGGKAEAAARLDAYLADASERARAADGAPLALFTTSAECVRTNGVRTPDGADSVVQNREACRLFLSFPALTAHVIVRRDCDCHAHRLRLAALLDEQYGISHSTLQVEHETRDTPLTIKQRA